MKTNVRIAIFALMALCSAVHAQSTDVAVLLQQNNTEAVEKLLGEVQRKFESSTATEVELRNSFRSVYNLDSLAVRNLVAWAATSPRSYIAHLSLGIYLKRRGLDVRGGKYAADTPRENMEAMHHYMHDAEKELQASLSLTSKPYLSIFHLMDIATHVGDRTAAKDLIIKANRVLPSNALARARYMVSLMPRWGGSYAEADNFIASTRGEGVPAAVIWQLEAIKSDDLGRVLAERGEHASALEQFERALQLGAKVGGSFTTDFLVASTCHVSRYNCR